MRRTPPRGTDAFFIASRRLPKPREDRGLALSESQLPRPEAQYVRFHPSRNDLLQSVLRWARAPEAGMAVQLRTGPGGAGKTRLMLDG